MFSRVRCSCIVFGFCIVKYSVELLGKRCGLLIFICMGDCFLVIVCVILFIVLFSLLWVLIVMCGIVVVFWMLCLLWNFRRCLFSLGGGSRVSSKEGVIVVV